MTLDDFDFPDVAVDPVEVGDWTDEDKFMALAVELFREVGKIGGILGCIMPTAPDGTMGYWTRDQAILGGLLVRLSKLQIGFMTFICQRQQEIARLIFRSLFETAVNLIYLAEKSSPDLCEAYVRYSLRTDKDLLGRIDDNVRERGHELPIEQRMRDSIASLFEKSGVEISEIDPRERSPWGGSIYQRAKDVGYSAMYLTTFSMTSNEVHGNWCDLVFHHLEWSEEGYLPEIRWSLPRPQEVLAAGLILADAYERYSVSNLPQGQDKDLLLERLAKYKERLSLLTYLHEEFLAKESGESLNPTPASDC